MHDSGHQHERIEVQTLCAECGQELRGATFDRADIEQQQMSELPDREAMSLVNANIAIPVNLAAALNVLSDGSLAYAEAAQTIPIDQSTGTDPITWPLDGNSSR
jgi:hypothetical protein